MKETSVLFRCKLFHFKNWRSFLRPLRSSFPPSFLITTKMTHLFLLPSVAGEGRKGIAEGERKGKVEMLSALSLFPFFLPPLPSWFSGKRLA